MPIRRKPLPLDVEAKVLVDCQRRCALCFGLDNNLEIQAGQIAHSDKDSKNHSESNLVFLCFRHHNEYDSITSQSKGITRRELLTYKKQLLATVAENRLLHLETFDVSRLIEQATLEFETFSESLTSVRVPADEWLPLDAESELRGALAEGTNNVICLLGEPGSGKTSLLARVICSGTERRPTVLAIRADQLPVDDSVTGWLQKRMQLKQSLLDTICMLAPVHPLWIVVDQLDSLADLSDLKSNRLNEVLDFVRQCAQVPGVTVLCSCRQFEFGHDTRFASLEPAQVTLQLPSWDSVSARLSVAGIHTADTWHSEWQEMLRNPQYLTVYLDRFKSTGESDVMLPYRQLLDDLWQRKIRSAGQRNFVYRLTETLIETESLWAPLVKYEQDDQFVLELEAEHVIVREGGRVGFRHQTLLEHAKARLFIRNDQSLFDFVLARQDAILVRPTVWAVLSYLRDVDVHKYHIELSQLVNAELRLHLRFLLIDFLGKQSHPTDVETAHIVRFLQNEEDRARVPIAIQGNADWFQALRYSHLPAMMEWPPANRWPVASLLATSWNYARDDCFTLLSQHWLLDSDQDEFTTAALRGINVWDAETIAALISIIERTRSDDRIWWAEHEVYRIALHQPQLAAQVFSAVVRRPKPRSEGGTRVQSPLESTRDWYDLPTFAGSAPLEFLTEAWPWFVEVTCQSHSGRPSSVINEYGGHCYGLERDEDDIRHPMLESMIVAIRLMAKSDPYSFQKLIEPSLSTDNAVIHRLLARGFSEVAKTTPETALKYLLDDERRFLLGGLHRDQEDSMALVEAIATFGDDTVRNRLEHAILAWSQYNNDVDIDDRRDELAREARLRLLACIPDQYLSQSSRSLLNSEKLLLPDWNRRQFASRWGSVHEIPPLSKADIIDATDDDVITELQKPSSVNHDDETWDETEQCWKRPGGARSVSHELCELAKDNAGRVIPLLPKLLREGLEETTSSILHALANNDLTEVDAVAVIRELSLLRPMSDEYRSSAGYLLYKKGRVAEGLPDDVCEIIYSWLAQPWREHNAEDREPDGSILWGPSGGIILNSSALWPLLALSCGYLERDPPDTAGWLEMQLRLLELPVPFLAWKHYCLQLRWISIAGTSRTLAVTVITRLFGRYPLLAASAEGIRLIALIADELPTDFVESFLCRLKTSQRERLRQAYGEVLPVIACWRKSHSWSVAQLEQDMQLARNDASMATGIAYAAAHLWDRPSSRRTACELLCRLIPHANEDTASAISQVFWAVDDFAADEQTKKLFECIADHPNVLVGQFAPDLVEHAARLLPHCRPQVLRVAESVLRLMADPSSLAAQRVHLCLPQLANIAMTLQRYEDTRSRGLDLLEGLLRLGVGDAYTLLNNIDIRPSSTRHSQHRVRRRRRKPE